MTEEQNKLAEEIREVLEWTRALLRNIASASPEVLKHTDIEAFILNEINPALALTARLRVEREPATEAVLEMALTRMDRAREILRGPNANWGMLDTSDLRAALKGKGASQGDEDAKR